MTSPIIDFIEARLAEDEEAARAATGPWTAYAMRYFNEVSEEFNSIYAAFCWLADNDSCEKHVPDRICGPDGTALIDLETMGRLDREITLDEKLGAFETWLHKHHPLIGANPARVLREVAAKRALLADFADELRDAERHEDVDMIEAYTRLLGVLAAVYSDHPDYRKEWAA